MEAPMNLPLSLPGQIFYHRNQPVDFLANLTQGGKRMIDGNLQTEFQGFFMEDFEDVSRDEQRFG